MLYLSKNSVSLAFGAYSWECSADRRLLFISDLDSPWPCSLFHQGNENLTKQVSQSRCWVDSPHFASKYVSQSEMNHDSVTLGDSSRCSNPFLQLCSSLEFHLLRWHSESHDPRFCEVRNESGWSMVQTTQTRMSATQYCQQIASSWPHDVRITRVCLH